MSVTLANPPAAETDDGEQRFVMGRVTWDAYVKISDALEDQPGLRMIYCDGRLAFVGKSRRHDWFAERLGEFVKAMARGLGIPWEDAGQATYRREKTDAGSRETRPSISASTRSLCGGRSISTSRFNRRRTWRSRSR